MSEEDKRKTAIQTHKKQISSRKKSKEEDNQHWRLFGCKTAFENSSAKAAQRSAGLSQKIQPVEKIKKMGIT